MPILDHLSEEIYNIVDFRSFHNSWAVHIAGDLNKRLPKGFRATPHAQLGSREVDVKTDRYLTLDEQEQLISRYQPPTPLITSRATFPIPKIEVFVKDVRRAEQITVGVIEIVSKGNKDRPESRDAFVAKCNNLLSDEISVIIADILAIPFFNGQAARSTFNLHNQLFRALEITKSHIKENEEKPLYCTAYRKTFDAEGKPAIDSWAYALKVGDTLPELPLFITYEVAVPVRLEKTYIEVCEGLKVFE